VACLTAAGYPNAGPGAVPFSFRIGPANLAFSQPWGGWGYLGAAEAEEYGFLVPPGSALSAPSGSDNAQSFGAAATPLASLPPGAQAAAGKCLNIVADFNNTQFAHSMAGIETMNDDISTDVVQDPDFKTATKAWSACMARNGYSSADADTLMIQELTALGLRGITPGSSSSGPTAAQNQAQIATAVTDADCTQATDLAGIYFAVQGSYEQQFVDANQQALNAEVRQYKAAFAAELSKLPALLRTTSVTPELPFKRRRPGGTGHAGRPSSPSPARS
jgi:hypothetical protein